MRKSNPKPTVTFEGNTYKLRSGKTEVPDLASMSHLSALIWINRNTTARGYSKTPNPLIGMRGALTLK